MEHPSRRRLPVQLSLEDARRPSGRGGWRPGAGRKRRPGACSHRARVPFPASVPLHVTLKVIGGLPSFRREAVARVVRAAIAAGGHRGDFRVVHYNVLGDHLHFVVEAAGAMALARGMQGLTIRLARRLNVLLGRRGKLFAQRYHARPLRTPTEVRNAIRYVLLNGRHHARDRGQVLARGWVDPYSSALWFDGWNAAVRTDAPWLRPLAKAGCPTAAPHTWLLQVGWRRGGGLIGVDEVPGPAP
ncbi:MAG: transposase [Myxococcales bacterium]|nr:transposase [Myxococcales bacterium]MBP6844610.1 transposase [Kofleriaceae bacterium]